MKILFKSITKYNKDIYDEFLAFHRKKYNGRYIFNTMTVIFLILAGIILQLRYHNFNLAILFCSILTFFILWQLFHPVSIVSKEYQSDKIQKKKEFVFQFYEKSFTVEDTQTASEVRYHQLHKVFETSSFFYLYVDKNHAFLVDKSNFSIGTSAEFSTFLQKKCWLKFKKFA